MPPSAATQKPSVDFDLRREREDSYRDWLAELPDRCPEPAADGETEVEVSRSAAPIVLVLSSYVSTSWRLNLAPETQLRQVIINGYEPSVLANQPDGVEVIDLTGPGRYLSACSYVWPGDDQGCDTPGLVRGAEARTGLTLTSSQGCYSGAGFVLRDQGRP